MKFFETIGVLIVFLILLGLAMIFYNNFQEGSFRETQDAREESFSTVLLEKALLLPELDCSTIAVTRTTCIDVLKARAFANLSITNQQTYFTRFRSTTLTLHHLYPQGHPLVLYNAIPPQYKKKNTFVIPVTLHHPLTRTNAFGLLEVTHYAE